MTRAAEAFKRSIQDAEELLTRFDDEKDNPNGRNPETLKRACLVLTLAAWETYVKDRFREEFSVWLRAVDGSPVGKFVRKRHDEDLKRFYNPNSDRIKRLFLDYFEVDITTGWIWDNYDVTAAKKALDKLVAKRGDAAHQANTSKRPSGDAHLVKREDLEKAIRFIKGLVAATDKVKVAK